MAKQTGFLEKLLGVGRRAAPPAFKAPFYGGQKLSRTKKPGLKKARTGGFPSFSVMGGQKQLGQAEEYATTGRINFDDPYWRKQAEATWGKATAKKLAQLNRESKFAKKSAKENLDLTLERIGQDRTFAGEDWKATIESLGKEQEWSQREFNEVWENVIRMRKYLREDFKNTVTELAYQRGVERQDIAQNLMPLGEKVREEAWEAGLGSKGMGSREARNINMVRTQQIQRAKKQEEFGTKAAEITKTRGLEESDAIEKQAKRKLTQTGEEIALRGSAAQRNYNQAMKRYGLEEKGARVGYGQQIGGIDLSARGAKVGLEEAKRIGIEQFVQARKGEAYARAASDPYGGVKSVQTPSRRTSMPRIQATRRSGSSSFSGGTARKSKQTSTTGRFLRGLRRLF